MADPPNRPFLFGRLRRPVLVRIDGRESFANSGSLKDSSPR